MDFAFSEEQSAVSGLARKIFGDLCTPATLKTIDAREDRFHRELWSALAQAGLLGTAIPESEGGSGHGLLEACALLMEAGAAVAPVPLWATVFLGALPVAELGTPEQRRRLLPGVVTGQTILTAALVEPAGGGGGDDPAHLQSTATADGAAWILRGQKICVPAAHLAQRVLVPAAIATGGVGVFLVDPRGPGVTMERQVATSGEPMAALTFANVRIAPEDVLADATRGAPLLDWLVARATVGLCAQELGLCERALRMTAAYTTGRKQFDRPIATFQAVAQRAADAYIDVETIRLATWHAAWRLSAGLPAAQEVAIAKYWAAEAGHRVVYAAQHLHGGIGFDLEYPLHRYYTLSRQIELTLGSGTAQLTRLGAQLAAKE